jgi:hypothetical protein
VVSPHDVPTAQQLVESVREWLQRDVMTATSGRLQFHARVAINVLAMVERELDLGLEQADRHRQRLAALGFSDDQELADAIRTREVEPTEALRLAVWDSVIDKLAVANPGYAPDRRQAAGREERSQHVDDRG